MSESEFWEITFEEYRALEERYMDWVSLMERFAAMPTHMIWNANRGRNQRHRGLDQFMELTKQWKQRQTPTPAQPAVRTAKPGEKPPSRRAPGTKDTTIDRFDAYMKAVGAKVRYG